MPTLTTLEQVVDLKLVQRDDARRGTTFEVRYPGLLNQRYSTLEAAREAFTQALAALAAAPVSTRGRTRRDGVNTPLFGVSFFDARRALNTIPGSTHGAGGVVSTLPGSIDEARAAERAELDDDARPSPMLLLAAAAAALLLGLGRRS